MQDYVAASLRAHRARHAEERLAASEDWRDFGLVFATSKGTPIEPRRLDTEFKRDCGKQVYPAASGCLDARHFAATVLLKQIVHPRTGMEILGHGDISLTMNTYSHVLTDTMREAAEKIQAVFGGR